MKAILTFFFWRRRGTPPAKMSYLSAVFRPTTPASTFLNWLLTRLGLTMKVLRMLFHPVCDIELSHHHSNQLRFTLFHGDWLNHNRCGVVCCTVLESATVTDTFVNEVLALYKWHVVIAGDLKIHVKTANNHDAVNEDNGCIGRILKRIASTDAANTPWLRNSLSRNNKAELAVEGIKFNHQISSRVTV